MEVNDKEIQVTIREKSERQGLKPKATEIIYVDRLGNSLDGGFPTTAKDGASFYVVVVQDSSQGGDPVRLIVSGTYVLPLQTADDAREEKSNDNPEEDRVKLEHVIFGPYGPYSDKVTFAMEVRGADGQFASVFTREIKLQSRVWATVGVGLLGSGLRDPSNLQTLQLPSGDSTYIADGEVPSGRVALTTLFYLWERYTVETFGVRRKDPRQRLGLLLGTQLNKEAFDNLYVGFSYEFSRGISFTGGAHFGNRNIVEVDGEDFVFGETPRAGDVGLVQKERWGAGVFLGFNVDTRLVGHLLKLPE